MRKGSIVQEDTPFRLDYCQKLEISLGQPDSVTIALYVSQDSSNKGPPRFKDDSDVTKLVHITADLKCLSIDDIPCKTGADGKGYYIIDYTIEIKHYSAYTTYELFYNDVSYGMAHSEYV